ncbi:MAG: hypothetical protein ABSG85_04695 [Spirochaetia bacterium]|jgi:hypothetical protein
MELVADVIINSSSAQAPGAQSITSFGSKFNQTHAPFPVLESEKKIRAR